MNRDILKLPNLLSLFRIAMSVALYLLFVRHFNSHALVLFIMYIIIALTDLVDGIIARRFNMVTELGKELDPMADKVLVFLMLFAFWRIDLLPLWVILPIFLRDFYVNYLRKRSKQLGICFKTSHVAKAKTAVQMIFIGFVLAIPVVMSWNIPKSFYNFLANLVSGNALLIIMCAVMVFTVYSGVDYFVKFRRGSNKL